MDKRTTMFIATMYHYLIIICIQIVCSSYLGPSELDYKDIVYASYDRCVVTIPETLADEKALSLLSSAADVFKNEPKVSFHLVDFSDAKGLQDSSQIQPANSFIVFPLLRKDRTCLLTPPAKSTESLKPSAYSFKKETDYNIGSIVTFINEKCLTFRKINGNLTPPGIHEEYIVNNLFSVSMNEKVVISTNNNNDDGDDDEEDSDFDESFCAANLNDIGKSDCAKDMDSAEKYKSVKSQLKIEHHCERITLPTSPSEFFNDYVTMSKPVILTGATSHWPVFTKWKNQYLIEKYGDIIIHIKITPNGEYEGVESTSLWENKSKVKIPQDVLKQLPFPDLVVVRPATMEIRFSEFVQLIESIASSKSSNISAYLEYSSISYFPDLEKDISEMNFIKGILDLKHTNVWLSDGNTIGKLHFDPFDNFMCQISGEKEFILYDPHANERLYESHIQEAILSYNSSGRKFHREKLLESTSMVMSPVDIEKPDLKRFPKFSEAKPMSCKIQPGEVLFTPAFWWHEVRSQPSQTERRNLAVNFWYDPFFLKEFPCPECKLYINPKYFHLL